MLKVLAALAALFVLSAPVRAEIVTIFIANQQALVDLDQICLHAPGNLRVGSESVPFEVVNYSIIVAGSPTGYFCPPSAITAARRDNGYSDEFASKPDLVTPEGEVIIQPDEVLVQPDPGQPGAPPGIGTPNPTPAEQENEAPPMDGTPDDEGAPQPVRE